MKRLLWVLTFIAATFCPLRVRSDEPPKSQAEWVAVLTKSPLTGGSGYVQLDEFVRSDPEVVFGAMRAAWPRIDSVLTRRNLISLLVNGSAISNREGAQFAANPHLLEILGIGLGDGDSETHGQSAQALSAIAFRTIRTRADLDAWRAAAGSGTIDEILARACSLAITDLDNRSMEDRARAYERILRVPFHGGRYLSISHGEVNRGITVGGLYNLRRDAAQKAGLIAIVERGLDADNPPAIRHLALRLIAHFVPDDAALAEMAPAIRREAPALLQYGDTSEVYDLLAQIKERWVVDMLIDRVATVDSAQISTIWMAANALGNTGDPRAIPSLIALYDAARPGDFLGQTVERGLALLTNVTYDANGEHDGDWWRDWWQEHRREFPAEVRDLPYPQIAGIRRPSGFSLRRHVERRTLGPGGGEYWLVSPGIVAAEFAATRPGLAVVFTAAEPAQTTFSLWQQRAAKAWDSRYLVAILPWHQPGTPGAESRTAASLVANVFRDAAGRTPIDPRHVTIVGEGAAGTAAYACSLDPACAYRDYVLLDAPFRSAVLPPLTNAAGRRYFLLSDKSSRAAPYVLVLAGANLLTKNGASVRMEPTEATEAATIAGLRHAIEWLLIQNPKSKT